jgi:hypothetical protein
MWGKLPSLPSLHAQSGDRRVAATERPWISARRAEFFRIEAEAS